MPRRRFEMRSKVSLKTILVALALMILGAGLAILGGSKAQATSSWVKIGGPAGKVFIGWNGLYASTPSFDAIYQYDGVPMRWHQVGGPGQEFAVGRFFLYGLSPGGGGVYQYLGIGMQWTQIGGPATHIYAGWEDLYATSPGAGDIYRYNRTPMSWTKIGGPGKAFVVDNSNGQIYAITPDGSAVYKYERTPMVWTRIGGPAANIYAGGNCLFATNPTTGDIYYYNGTPMSWTKIGGPGKAFAVDGRCNLYGLAPDGSAVYKYKQTPMAWSKIGGPAADIFAGADQLVALSPGTREVYLYQPGGAPGASYIVVTLDEVFIHNDQDPAGSGEVKLLAASASRGKAQRIFWPVEHWHDADNGTHLLDLAELPVDLREHTGVPALPSADPMTKLREAIPLFAMKESEMGDELALSIIAVEDDQLPGWLAWLIAQGLGKVAGLIAEWAGGGPLAKEAAEFVGKKIGEALAEKLSEADTIGIYTRKFSRAQDWGVSQYPYMDRVKDMTVRYRIQRVTVPENLKVQITGIRVITLDDSDPGSGECYLVARAAGQFAEGGDLLQQTYRFPSQETKTCDENHEGRGNHIWQITGPILEIQSPMPFFFLEIAMLEDEDDPDGFADVIAIMPVTIFPWLDSLLAEPRNRTVKRWFGAYYRNSDRGGGSATILFEVTRFAY